MFNCKRVASVFLLIALFGFSLVNVHAGEPTEQLKTDVDRIIKILNDKTLAKDQRDQRIIDLIRQRFDFRVMSQWILGVKWRKATPDQRDRFIRLFTQLLENTYKGRIEAYTGNYSEENVKYVEEKIKKGRALVKTLIVTESNEIPVNYKLSKKSNEWRVYDVVIEEVSLVRNYRSTYGEIVKKEGFEGLFSRMEKKIEELKNPPAKEPQNENQNT
jgi:phospholipid transport system substrate-binding protein